MKMLNQVMLIGKIKDLWPDSVILEAQVSTHDKRIIIPVYITELMRSNIGEHANVGDVIGVKGYLNSEYGCVKVIGEKITLLTNRA